MNARNTWLWVLLAAGLFAFIYFVHHPGARRSRALGPVLPDFKPAAVSQVQLQPLGISVERTNGGWHMSRPLSYPAQADRIERLLVCLQDLTPAMLITNEELAASRSNIDEMFGFSQPQVTLLLQQGGEMRQVRVGKRTLPGNQVYVQVPGATNLFVVDADWLKLLPPSTNDWRNSSLLSVSNMALDSIAVTNGPNIFVLERDPTNHFWHMSYPNVVRADSDKIEHSLQQLLSTRVSQFVSDDPRSDLEALGLNPPEFELALGQGSNQLALLQFGKSPTNDPGVIYARHASQNTVLGVPKGNLAPWKGTEKEFRDPYLVSLPSAITSVDVVGRDQFTLRSQADGSWQMVGDGFPLDADLIKEFLSNLSDLQVVQYVKDLALEETLPKYGLAKPERRYVLRFAAAGAAPGATNLQTVELQFGGLDQQGRVYARRKDETSVYAVALTNVQALPDASWQLRRRQLWSFDTNAVVGVTIRQQGRVRQLIRRGLYQWSLAPGSQGSIDNLVVEQTVHELARVSAEEWMARGEQQRARYGIKPDGYEIILELKDGGKADLQFGAKSRLGGVYAAATLDGELWVFEFPGWLYDYVMSSLSIPEAS